ncbi:MAG TPA: alpha/beta fold hydrolase [Candidatus Elarobacter sp.]|nr:alpha/beta fold hydrolase [Candidatus Elarobacter sp.]
MNETVVFCFPYAGAGASVYRGFTSPAAAGIAVAGIQLPGREELFDEEPYATIGVAAADLAAQVLESARGRRYWLFGHSFGAVLAFEVARRLCGSRAAAPQRLVVSGSVAPGTSLGRSSSGLTDDEFVARVEQIAGYAHPALNEPELRELLLPALRVDVALHESYRPASAAPLDIPITALRGTVDTSVSAADCAQWAAWTSNDFAYMEIGGSHMYLVEDPAALIRTFVDIAAPLPVPDGDAHAAAAS